MAGEYAGEINPVVNSRDDHYCFGCGGLNPHGLRLRFTMTADGDGVQAPFTPAREHEGFTELVHGGIISAVLDEAMGWAVTVRDIWAVTGRLAVSFRRPVEVGVPIVVVGRVVSDRGRVVDAEAELRRADDALLLASAEAMFVRVPEDQAAAWRQRYGVD